jgi:hypothetical protein
MTSKYPGNCPRARRRLGRSIASCRRVDCSSLPSAERHLFGSPQTHATPDETQPYHEVVLFGAVEVGHSFSEEAGMDEEAGNTCNRVMLKMQRNGWLV